MWMQLLLAMAINETIVCFLEMFYVYISDLGLTNEKLQ